MRIAVARFVGGPSDGLEVPLLAADPLWRWAHTWPCRMMLWSDDGIVDPDSALAHELVCKSAEECQPARYAYTRRDGSARIYTYGELAPERGPARREEVREPVLA